MAFQAVPDCAEVTIVGELAGQACINTLYFTQSGDWGVDELDELLFAVDNLWGSFVDTYLCDNYDYLRVEGRGLRSVADVQSSLDTSATSGGVSGALPGNVTIACARRSGLTGRSQRGRVFVGGIPSGARDTDNTISTTLAAAIEAVFTAIDAAAAVVDWTGVIVSRVQGGVPLAPAVAYTIAEWVIVDRVLDSMRRRLPGRGST